MYPIANRTWPELILFAWDDKQAGHDVKRDGFAVFHRLYCVLGLRKRGRRGVERRGGLVSLLSFLFSSFFLFLE